jgi:hypothetical protein
MGFTGGTYMTVQGETDTTHTQIGRNSPATLSFTNLRWLNSASWAVLTPVLHTPVDSPYGGQVPTSGQFKNWTNAH